MKGDDICEPLYLGLDFSTQSVSLLSVFYFCAHILKYIEDFSYNKVRFFVINITSIRLRSFTVTVIFDSTIL